MKVVITGGEGFLGSWVCERFAKRGDEVISYDNRTKYEVARTSYNVDMVRDYNRTYLEKLGVRLQKADIRNIGTLRECIKGSDFVMNCAAQPAMTIATENPVYDFEVNAGGTLNILQVCREYNIPMLNCSSIHVLGTGINDTVLEHKYDYKRSDEKINELHPTLTGKLTPLHASKITGETYVRTFSEAYGLKCATFRLTGMYGDRQCGTEEHAWMSLLAIKTLLRNPIQIIGTGKQVRDPIYASDVVDAVECWVNKGYPSGLYHIGGSTKTKISVMQYLDMLYELTNDRSVLEYGATRQGDLVYYVSDISKAQKELDWQPKTQLKVGVINMLIWLRNNLGMFKVK